MDGMSPGGAAPSVNESTPCLLIRSRSGPGVVGVPARENSSSTGFSNSWSVLETCISPMWPTLTSRTPMHETRIVSRDVGTAVVEHVPSDGMSLEKSDRLCRALLYSISHDLRTPLTAIRAIAAALRSADVDGDQRDAMLADVDHEAERLARLLANLLEASRIEAGAVRPMLVRVPVEELCRVSVNDARAALGCRLVGLDLTAHLAPILIDETMIRQALVNLLENAARHDPGPLSVRARRAGGFLEIRVIDHGPGVPASERERIFEAFQRLGDQPDGRRRGTGLGLAIARGFLAAHGGDVRVETTIGGGATFVVSLPIR
jgi:two-component system sensor histidine kinase KdpD